MAFSLQSRFSYRNYIREFAMVLTTWRGERAFQDNREAGIYQLEFISFAFERLIESILGYAGTGLEIVSNLYYAEVVVVASR